MSEILISARSIVKTYTARTKIITALKGVTLDICSREVMALLGENGAGKTTLSSIIATVHPPTSGELLCQGASVYDDVIQYRLRIGYCPQKPTLANNLTVKEHLEFAGRYFGLAEDEVRQRVDTLIEQFSLGPYADEDATILSGGYRQRLLIARSLVHKPKLLILDEPTVGLDPTIRTHLWQLIRKLRDDGISVLLTTHYLDEAEALADRVCILHKGDIRFFGTAQALKDAHTDKRLEDIFISLIKEENQE